jgi:hypothetical protein
MCLLLPTAALWWILNSSRSSSSSSSRDKQQRMLRLEHIPTPAPHRQVGSSVAAVPDGHRLSYSMLSFAAHTSAARRW